MMAISTILSIAVAAASFVVSAIGICSTNNDVLHSPFPQPSWQNPYQYNPVYNNPIQAPSQRPIYSNDNTDLRWNDETSIPKTTSYQQRQNNVNVQPCVYSIPTPQQPWETLTNNQVNPYGCYNKTGDCNMNYQYQQSYGYGYGLDSYNQPYTQAQQSAYNPYAFGSNASVMSNQPYDNSAEGFYNPMYGGNCSSNSNMNMNPYSNQNIPSQQQFVQEDPYRFQQPQSTDGFSNPTYGMPSNNQPQSNVQTNPQPSYGMFQSDFNLDWVNQGPNFPPKENQGISPMAEINQQLQQSVGLQTNHTDTQPVPNSTNGFENMIGFDSLVNMQDKPYTIERTGKPSTLSHETSAALDAFYGFKPHAAESIDVGDMVNSGNINTNNDSQLNVPVNNINTDTNSGITCAFTDSNGIPLNQL